MTRSIDLYELQETDSAIDAADRRLKEITVELEAETDFTLLDEQLNEAEAALVEAERSQHEANEAVTDRREKLRLLDEKLYSGEVKLPRELKTLQDEVQVEQRQFTSLEEDALARLEAVERLRAQIATARDERTLRLQERELLVGSLTAEQQDIHASLEQLRARRERQQDRVDPPDRILYERLRRARAGRAVAKVERGTCQGCRITLPTTVFQRARSGLKIVQCTSCERILYVV